MPHSASRLFGGALAVVVTFGLLAGCGKKADPVSTAAQADKQAGDRRARHRRDEGHRRGGLHLRPADRHELRGDERVRHRQELAPVQGPLQHHRQRIPRVHLGGHRGRHAEQRHPLLHALAGPPGGTGGDLRARGAEGALLLGAAHRRQHLQLRLHRQPGHGPRGRRLPGRGSRLDRRDARRASGRSSRRRRPSGSPSSAPSSSTRPTCPTS